MAGRKLKVNGGLSGSTMIEVVIAMVVILVVFGIAMMIYGNVSSFSMSAKKIRAQAVLEDRMSAIEQSAINLDETVTAGDFQVEQEIKVYGAQNSLQEIRLVARDANHQKVAELEKVIIAHDQ